MRRKRIAYITPSIYGELDIELWSGINDVLQKQEINLVSFIGAQIHAPNPSVNVKTIVFDLITEKTIQQFDGVIIWASSLFTYIKGQEILDFCKRFADKPIVSIDVQIGKYPYVIHDDKTGIKALIKHLVVEHNYQKIAFTRGPENNLLAILRNEAYFETLKELGLACDERLISPFQDWDLQKGVEFIDRLLDEHHCRPKFDFDAIVCSNTRQAKGVISQLVARGFQVPGDVAVTGFNDEEEARLLTPSITTADPHQYETGVKAGELMLRILNNEKIEESTIIPPKIILRNSCGCLDQTIVDLRRRKGSAVIKSKAVPETTLLAYQDQIYEHIVSVLMDGKITPHNAALLKSLIHSLLENLEQETRVDFYLSIKKIIQESIRAGFHSSLLQKIVYEINLQIFPLTENMKILSKLAKFNHKVLVMIYQYEYKYNNFLKFESEERNIFIARTCQKLVSDFELANLSDILSDSFSYLNADFYSVYLYEDRQRPLDKVSLFFSINNNQIIRHKDSLDPASSKEIIPAEDVLSDRYLPADGHYSLMIKPHMYLAEQIGLSVYKMGNLTMPNYADLQIQISSNLKGSFLLDERAKLLDGIQQKNTQLNSSLNTLWGEMELAKRIQTSILPKDTHVPGYRIATCMRPASLVGGDFYDILKSADNHYWINIGDVTGHGVTAGLIMLMLQTTLLSLIRSHPGIGPAELICQSNEIIYYNLQSRLMVDHFITTCFTKLDPEGNGSFAGAHLDILIYRSEKKRVERIVTDGIWLGIVPDIREHTSEGTFKLGQGDLLFLYTDGVVEIANNKHEQYEMGRLVRFLERNGDKPPETVAGLLVKELEAFQDEQKDDFTFLVIKKELAGA